MFVVATLRGVGVTERLGGSQTPGDNQLIKYPSCCSGLATNIWSDPTHHFSNFPAWVPVEEQLYFIILLAVADISQPATSWQNLTAVTSNPWHWKPNLSSGLFQLVDETLGRPLPCIFRKAKGSHNTFLPLPSWALIHSINVQPVIFELKLPTCCGLFSPPGSQTMARLAPVGLRRP